MILQISQKVVNFLLFRAFSTAFFMTVLEFVALHRHIGDKDKPFYSRSPAAPSWATIADKFSCPFLSALRLSIIIQNPCHVHIFP